MSYTLTPYLVDLNKLRKAVGSKDKPLIAAVMEGDREAFESMEDQEDEEEIPLSRALQDLVMGKEPQGNSAHQYGYALEHLCRHLGEPVTERDQWTGSDWRCIEATGVEEILTKTGSPVSLPPIDNFPTIGHLTAKQIAAIVAKLGDGQLKTAAPSGRKPRRSLRSWLLDWIVRGVLKLLIGGRQRGSPTKEDIQELLKEYEGWLREAAAKKKALVFFYY